MDFYANIAETYDEMTRFDERLQSEKAVLQKWVDRYQIQSAMDVACGTGLHSILLSGMGVRTVGADISDEMLQKAKLHAADMGVKVRWVQSSLQELRQNIKGEFDAVLCLGNSIPHLLNQSDLYTTFQNFSDLLKPEGIAVIQLLNYRRMLANKERIVGIHRQGKWEYIRFYDFQDERIQFNILTINWSGNKNTHSLNSTLLYPYGKEELEQALHKKGFTDLQYYGDMQFNPFELETSPNLVVVGKKHVELSFKTSFSG